MVKRERLKVKCVRKILVIFFQPFLKITFLIQVVISLLFFSITKGDWGGYTIIWRHPLQIMVMVAGSKNGQKRINIWSNHIIETPRTIPLPLTFDLLKRIFIDLE